MAYGYRDTTVLILEDFRIKSLPTVPNHLGGHVDVNIWNQFTALCQQRINATFTSSEPGIDLNRLGSKRRCYQLTYWICAPLTCVLGYVGYYCLVLAQLHTGLLALGASLLLAAFVCMASATVTAVKVRSLMRRYRMACQQDLNSIFMHFNASPDSILYLSEARSTHRNNGTVQLGILVSLKNGDGANPDGATTSTSTGTTGMIMYQPPTNNVMPIQMQQVAANPVQLPNGQVVYQVVTPAVVPPPSYNQAVPMYNEGDEGRPLNAVLAVNQQRIGNGETAAFVQYQ